MSGQFPITDFTQVTITSNTPTMVTTAISGFRQAKQVAAQFWTVEADLRPLTVAEAKRVQGFLARQRNSLYDFTIVLPRVGDASGGIAQAKASFPGVDSTVTSGAATAGTTSVNIVTNFTQAQFGSQTVLQAGDYIKFAGHSKVYQVVFDAYADLNGDTSITVFPNLVATVGAGEEVIYNQVPFTMFNTNTATDTAFTVGDEVAISIKLQEAL